MPAVGWLSRLVDSLSSRTSSQDRLAAYVIREHGLGHALDDILDDPYLRNRASDTEIRALFERPDVVRAVGQGAVDELRSKLG
jgi:hypothetical protein